MFIKKVLDEAKSIINADNIILYFPNVKAQEHRVNLHVSDMKQNGHIGADDTRNPYNLGDYLGLVVTNWMLHQRGLSLDGYVEKKKHLLTVGSGAVKSYQNMTVWGSGVERELPQWFRRFFQRSWFRKLDIRAVRGPLTRDYLTKLGHQCPAVYGDPAILMPLIYNEDGEKSWGGQKYDVSIIPQLVTEEGIREKYPDAHIISMNTDGYKGVIDQIVQSKLIISSSLHGIILADAYGVPSVWYRGLGKDIDFKYRDYYGSTGRELNEVPTSVEEALETEPLPLPDLKPLQEKLMEVFPYDLWKK